jgi:hypothetical protein
MSELTAALGDLRADVEQLAIREVARDAGLTQENIRELFDDPDAPDEGQDDASR